jgi:putative ABC transport system ATP-binding protein
MDRDEFIVSLRGVEKTYPGPPPVEALRACDLQVAPGDYLAIVGPSGSGKSTLLNLMGLLDRPSAGVLTLSGQDTQSLSDGQRTALRGRRIGFVFQSFHLLPHRTALENVNLAQLYQGGSRKQRTAASTEILQLVGLGHRMHSLPTHLSGGERQRVAIARALVNRPALLLCDEPTGNLDSVTAGVILDLLDDLHSRGVTIVVITHDQAVSGRGRRVARIADGRLRCAEVTVHA